MKIWLLIVAGLIASLSPDAVAQTKIKVNRHKSSSMIDSEAKAILEKGSVAVRLDTGRSCGLSLTADGTVTVFSVGNGSISTRKDYRDVCNTGGYVHVVNDIAVCGSATLAPNLTIIGCSDTPGTCEEVVRLDTTVLEESLWMHEYGHTKGLLHRTGANLLMNPILGGADQFVVSADECSTMTVSSAMERTSGPPTPAGDIRQFVRRLYYHGLPLQEARAFSPSAVAILLKMLDDPADAEYWPNVVAAIGMLGDDGVVDPLLAFLRRRSESAPHATFRAKLQVPLTFGYIVHERKSERALALLEQGVNPATWSGVELPGSHTEASAELLVQRSLLGLGASGDERAMKFLASLRRDPRFERNRQRLNVLNEAIAMNARIGKEGLR